MQWGDFDKTGQAVIASNMAAKGMVKSNIGARAEQAQRTADDPSNLDWTRHKAGINAGKLRAMADTVVDKPITMKGATDRRVANVKAGAKRTAKEGDPVTGTPAEKMDTPAGTGWYFKHHADIKAAADKHGFDTHAALTASAVMSPTNSPDNEKAAVAALMDAHKNHTVHMTPRLAKHLADATGTTVPTSQIGRRVGFSELHPEHVAGVSGTKMQKHVETGADLSGIARGGTKENIVKAVDVLRGNVHHSAAIDPHSSPKVWSYNNAIHNAVPGGAVHEEYLTRAAHVLGGGQSKGHEPLDLFGLRGSKEGILDPGGHTAEDTWQNTQTFGQPNHTLPGSKTNVAKHVASDKVLGLDMPKKAPVGPNGGMVTASPDARVGSSTMLHAFNNKATVDAAAKLSKGTGVSLPSVVAQEVGWTEIRRSHGKDPAYNAAKAAPKESRATKAGNQLKLKGI